MNRGAALLPRTHHALDPLALLALARLVLVLVPVDVNAVGRRVRKFHDLFDVLGRRWAERAVTRGVDIDNDREIGAEVFFEFLYFRAYLRGVGEAGRGRFAAVRK